MAITSTNHKVGSFLTTNAALEIKGDKVGFRPRKIRLLCWDTAKVFEWQEGMDDATAFKMGDTAGTGGFAKVTTEGVTPLATGFGLGTATDLNSAAGKVVHFECWG